MAAYKNEKKGGLALVLSGGGAKGSYEIGVWKALRETGLDKKVSAISGCSVGALNAMFFATGDYDKISDLWLRVSDLDFRLKHGQYEGVYEETLGYKLVRKTSGDAFISQSLLKSIVSEFALGNAERLHRYLIFSSATEIKSAFDLAKIMAFPRSKRKPAYMNWSGLSDEEIMKAIMASSALPLIYASVEFRGKRYCDGCLIDNTPVKPLYDCGYRRFIVVHLDHRNAYFTKASLRQQRALGIKAVNIIPGKGFRTDINAMVRMTREITEKRIEAGYNDAKALFKGMFHINR